MPSFGPSRNQPDGLGEERKILLGCQAPHITDHEGLWANPVTPPKTGAVSMLEMARIDARGHHIQWSFHATLTDHLGDTLARSDDLIAQVAVSFDEVHDELTQVLRMGRHVVKILLVHRMIREYERTLKPTSDSQSGTAQKVRMVRVDNVGPERLKVRGKITRDG
jgi:hypothetical protein